MRRRKGLMAAFGALGVLVVVLGCALLGCETGSPASPGAPPRAEAGASEGGDSGQFSGPDVSDAPISDTDISDASVSDAGG
jgi:hypothetical protein